MILTQASRNRPADYWQLRVRSAKASAACLSSFAFGPHFQTQVDQYCKRMGGLAAHSHACSWVPVSLWQSACVCLPDRSGLLCIAVVAKSGEHSDAVASARPAAAADAAASANQRCVRMQAATPPLLEDPADVIASVWATAGQTAACSKTAAEGDGGCAARQISAQTSVGRQPQMW